MADDTTTLGVVLTIPDPWGVDLQERRAGYGDTVAWTIPTHVTLLPPTQVPRRRLASVDDHLREVAGRHRRFSLGLHGADTFRPVTQTSFVAVAEGADTCRRLADEVRSGPLRRQLPFAYHPHVTMAMDLPDAVHDEVESDLADYSLRFEVSTLDRYELAEHGVWEPVAAFPLVGHDR